MAEPSKPIIAIVGSLNTDLITRTPRIAQGGETLLATSFATGCGGKGANQAVACARLSRRKQSRDECHAHVNMLGAVGDDVFGDELIASLKGDDVDVSGVSKRKGQRSGVANIIVEEESGENRILLSPGANYTITGEDVTSAWTGGDRSLLPQLIILQLEIPLDTVLSTIKFSKNENIPVLLNPAPAQKLPRDAYDGIDSLVVNETEAAIVTGQREDDWSAPSDSPHLQALCALRVPHTIITLGGSGVRYIDTNSRRDVIIPADKVQVKDTTAAGDTFVGALAVAMVCHYAGQAKGTRIEFDVMKRIIGWANRAAGKTVQREGAQSSIPWLDEVDAMPL